MWRSRLIALGLLALSGHRLCAGAQSDTRTDFELAQVVRALGAKDEKVADDFQRLRQDPHAAVRLLVAELHPIPRKLYYEHMKTQQSNHVISCLRALHYLTGLTFSAKTASRLTDDERQFLDFDKEMHDSNPTHKLHFFGVWMSRNADCVAPDDVQRAIIKQWQQWQQQNGATFQYRPAKSPTDSMEEWVWWG
jgi:hypothetical protein